MEKKNYLLVGLLALGMASLSSCGDELNAVKPGNDVDPGLKGQMEELAPSAAKQTLQDVGIEFIEAIGASDHENLVEVAAFLIDGEYAGYDIDDDYYDKLEELYEEVDPEDEGYAISRRVNPVAAVQGLMEVSLDAAQNGAQLSTRAADIYMLTVKAGLTDLYGGFEPNEKKEEWVYDASITDRLEVKFTDDHNVTWTATLKGSSKTSRIHMAYEDIYSYKSVYAENKDYGHEEENHDISDVTIDVPQNITFVVQRGSETIIDLTVDSELDVEYDIYDNYEEYRKYKQIQYYDEVNNYSYPQTVLDKYEATSEFKLTLDYKNLSVDAKLNVNGYEESWVAKSSKKGGSTAAEVKIDGTSMLKYEASAKVDIDAFIEQLNEAGNYSESANSQEEYDELWEYDEADEAEEAEEAASYLENFSMYLDIMGKVQIVAGCEDFEALFKAAYITEEEEEAYGKMTTKASMEDYVAGINKTYSITIHYDMTKTVQANVELEVAKFEDSYDGESYYEIQPVLVFAKDNSRYTFEEYFKEKDFKKAIEAAEELAEEFEEMVNEYF